MEGEGVDYVGLGKGLEGEAGGGGGFRVRASFLACLPCMWHIYGRIMAFQPRVPLPDGSLPCYHW